MPMKSIYDMFSSKTCEDEEQFRSKTIGLVSAETYRRHKSSILQSPEPEKCQKKPRRDLGLGCEQNDGSILSFNFDPESEEGIKEESKANESLENGNELTLSRGAAKLEDSLEFSRIGKDASVDTAFLPDRKRELEELQAKKRLEAEELEREEKLKQEIIEVVFSYWDGSGHRRSVKVPRSTTIGEFLEECRIKLKSEFKEFSRLSR